MALSVLLIPAEVWCSFQAIVPPNRGEVTAAEFSENINKVADYLDYDLWVNEDGFELAKQTVDILTDGEWERREYGKPFDDAPAYTVETDENGYVTAVCIEREGRDSGEDMDWVRLPAWGSMARVITAAFQGTEFSGYHILRGPLMAALNQSMDGHRVQDGPFTLTILLEMDGYRNINALLVPEECWYHFSLRLEKSE